MGSFYVNFSVKREDPERVAAALKGAGCKAVVTPAIDGYVLVCEKECDTQDEKAIDRVGALISRAAEAPVLAVLNHDDDILCYWLFEDGRVSDSYNSCPDYFDELGEGESDSGGDSERLCKVLSAPSAAGAVDEILRSEDYAFAFDRHAALAEALGLPECSVGLGYRYLDGGELPEGLTADQLIRVG
jgi:hypothetical protein